MKLPQLLFLLQLASLCPALLPTSTPAAERNATQQPADLSAVPYVHRLGAKCTWTLRMPGNSSGEAVPLPPGFSDTLASRICRDLNCGSVHTVKKSSAPPGSSCFQGCLYRDLRLQNCTKTADSACSVATRVVCGHQSLRLAGHQDRCAGRVEVWKDGRWGTVCDDGWDLRGGDVVCGQLGCGTALRVTGQGGPFPAGRGPVHLDELNCTGAEDNLWACGAAQDESDCGHKEDAGVVCSGSAAFAAETTAAVTLQETSALTAAAPPAEAPPPQLLSIMVLSLALVVLFILNVVLCCLYRQRHVLFLQQTRCSERSSTDPSQNHYKENLDLKLVSVDGRQPDDSQRNRTDVKAAAEPPALSRLAEEGSGPPLEDLAAFPGYQEGAAAAEYSRVSKVSQDSFETSSTSSGECYQNVNPRHPEPGRYSASPSPPLYTNTCFEFGAEATEPSSDDDDYSPVSPD